MIQYTNYQGLPKAYVNAVKTASHEVPDNAMSVTRLISAPRQFQLKQRHDYKVDASECMFAFLGNAVHAYLADNAEEQAIVETLFTADFNGQVVSGKPDEVHNDTLTDYKTCSAWSAVYGIKDDWIKQLSIYRWLLQENGVTVTNARIIAFYRNWSASSASRNSNYPAKEIAEIQIPLMRKDDIHSFLAERINLHQEAESLIDSDLPPCTAEERWEKPAAWAVYKTPNSKRVLKVFEDENLAYDYAGSKGQNATVVYRPAEQTRCDQYCPVAQFCSQRAEIANAVNEKMREANRA